MKTFLHKYAEFLGAACILLLFSTSAGAVPMVWGSGNWGDEWQAIITTSTDSDGDGVANSLDVFPLDPAEWSDADMDGIGDNADIDDDNDGIADFPDPDDDNDGLTDLDESILGTNPLNADTDGDGLSDGEEVMVGRNPLVNEAAAVLPAITILLDD